MKYRYATDRGEIDRVPSWRMHGVAPPRAGYGCSPPAPNEGRSRSGRNVARRLRCGLCTFHRAGRRHGVRGRKRPAGIGRLLPQPGGRRTRTLSLGYHLALARGRRTIG